MTDDDPHAKEEREILELLAGLCSQRERDELRIAALRALLADVRGQQAHQRGQGEG